MSPITTHVLDTFRGRPAAGVELRLERVSSDGSSAVLARGATDADGRARGLLPDGTQVEPGTYRMVFETGAYFRAQMLETFYPRVAVEFEIAAAGEHYHVPLLLSPFGYSTYRGS